ncbi:MAG TPA: TonB-dependent receptor plug domain-containing protein, partial [Burkholderiaceae bacterium]
MRSLQATRLAAALATLCCAGPAFASQGSEPPKVMVQGQAGGYDARRYDTATKIVVTRDEILKNGDTTLGEALKRLPGVTLGGVQGRGGDIRMRGLGNGYTQILLNGEPSPPGFSLDSLAPDMMERVEIMRAASAEFSAQGIAGAINVVLRKTISTAQRELKLGAGADNGQPGANLNLLVADRDGALSYALNTSLVAARYERPRATLTDTVVDGAGRLVSQRA